MQELKVTLRAKLPPWLKHYVKIRVTFLKLFGVSEPDEKLIAEIAKHVRIEIDG
jgi:hypothetical protein